MLDPRQEMVDLTAARALFAAWVFAYHINLHAQFAGSAGPFAAFIGHGYLGVDGFFILSGLVLARVHPTLGTAPRDVIRFYAKRLLRIYPVHLATILLLASLFVGGTAMGLAPRDPLRFSASALVEHLLLIQGWGATNHWAWNYPSWSISTEWAGYLLFPFILAIMLSIDGIIIGSALPLLAMLLGLVAYASGHGLNLTFAGSLLRFFPEFIAGIATARIVPYFADDMPGTKLAIAGFVVTLAGCLFGSDWLAVIGLWGSIIGFAFQADAERTASLGRIPFMRSLGLLSYAFYMSFAPIELITAQLFRKMGIAPSSAKLSYSLTMIVGTFVLASVLHVLVERPCRLIANRRFSEQPPLAPSSLPL
ncbi:MAG: acyltransferase [Rhodospirillales bacterium 20-60-12]|nr:MAG: acyltransferase [Rhodospirillales bacterium 20-60-12]HQT66406.1 acyltransferase [Acetobacteraceae bacterium]